MTSFPNIKRKNYLLASCFLLLLASSGWTQIAVPFSVPTGLRPLGVAGINTGSASYAAVANSGDNSVSIFQLNPAPQNPLTLLVTVTGIPSPYGVFECFDGTRSAVLVTSPSENSVRLISVPQGQVLGTMKTGAQPYSAVCYNSRYPTRNHAVVSNLGDSTITVFDLISFQILQTFQGVPGSRGFHGVTVWVRNFTSGITGVRALVE